MANTNRILVKLRPSVARAAAAPRANLRPLYDAVTPAAAELRLGAAPAWYLADLPDGGPTPWDAAHARVADQLGIAESDVLYAEPDLPQCYPDLNEKHRGEKFAVGSDCQATDQQDSYGRVKGPGFAWHLRNEYSQLASARDAVQFTDPRTRIAHIDTGYDKSHATRPEHILEELERNFADGNDQPNSAQDPNRRHLFDNSGHGTGTIGILAGRQVAQNGNAYIGGTPQANILPIRIANSVILFYTSVFAQALQYAIQQQCDVVSISMGGLPSAAWNEAVNAAYEAGICIAALTQSRQIQVQGATTPQIFRGGSTLIVDLAKPAIQYKITKRVDNEERERSTKEFLKKAQEDPLRALLVAPGRREPFAALHLLAEVGGF